MSAYYNPEWTTAELMPLTRRHFCRRYCSRLYQPAANNHMNLNLGGFLGAALGAAIGFGIGRSVWDLGSAGTVLVVGLIIGAFVGNATWSALRKK